MLLIRKHGSSCPFCSTADPHPSRTRRREWPLRLFLRPRRCRQCNLRFWTTDFRAAGRLLLAALVLAAVGMLVWWVLSAAVLLGTTAA